MTKTRSRLFVLALPALFTLAASGCMGMADHQSARTVGAGNAEITPGASLVYTQNRDDLSELEWVGTAFGARAAYGVANRFDIVAGAETFRLRGSDEEARRYGLAAGPKVGIIENRLAAFLPVGLLFGRSLRSSDTWTAVPTLLGTIPLSEQVDLVPSGKAFIALRERSEFDDAFETAYGFNLGLGLRPSALHGWTFRPELGIVVDPDIEGTRVFHLSVGISRLFGR